MNLILSAHANKLKSPPTFLENSPQVQSIPGIFRNPVGNNSMTINLPPNVALVFYQDIYNIGASGCPMLNVARKDPGKICHGRTNEYPEYPGLITGNRRKPERIIAGGSVPNMALWPDENNPKDFYSGMTDCANRSIIVNIDKLPDRWREGNYVFQCLLSEIINGVSGMSRGPIYIHFLACVGGIQGVDRDNSSGIGGTDMGDITYQMRGFTMGGRKRRRKHNCENGLCEGCRSSGLGGKSPRSYKTHRGTNCDCNGCGIKFYGGCR